MKHPFWIIAIITALAVPLSACLINESSAADAALSMLDQGDSSGINSQRFEVIRDAASLDALWREHTAVMDPPPALPQIDFEHDMVIAAFMGQRGTGGYTVQISKLNPEGSALSAQITFTRPGADCLVTQAITQPYHIVVTPRQEHVISFQVATITHDCN